MDLLPKLMPVRMAKLKCIILDEYIEDVLNGLQHLSLVHIVDISENLSRWEKIPELNHLAEEIKSWEETKSRIEKCLKKLKIKRDLGLLEEIFLPENKKEIEIKHSEEKKLLNSNNQVIDFIEEEIKKNIERYALIRKFLIKIMKLEIDVEKFRTSNKLFITIGQTNADNISEIERNIKKIAPHSLFYSKGKGRKKFLVIISLKRFAEEINNLLIDEPFEKVEIPEDLSGYPNHCIRLIDEKENEVLRKTGPIAMKLYDVITGKIERLNALEKIGKTERVFIIEGWIPEDKKQEIKKIIKKTSKGYSKILVEKPEETEKNIPTLLNKRRIVESYNVITEMYGLPRYDEIDPTPIIAFFFPFFVGLMMGDISLGLILLLGGYLIYRGAGSRSKKMADLAKILFMSGIVSIFFGILTGQFLGGALNTLTQGQISLPILWMSPADDPINFMIIVLVIGVVHLVVGLVLGVINNVTNHKIKNMFGDQISIFLMFFGGAIIVVSGNYQFEGYGLLGFSSLIIGIGVLLISKGPIGLLEITKIVSNIISYVRILALNMATTWMGRTFVLLSGMLVNLEYLGIPLVIALLLFSQFFLVFISSFSTFAHSMRLHYVEFFGRFYSGGGINFIPLKRENVYTKWKNGE